MAELPLAIAQYSEAIKANPQDWSVYYERAKLYEQQGNTRLALDDLSSTIRLLPSCIDALFRHGMYYFNNWYSL